MTPSERRMAPFVIGNGVFHPGIRRPRPNTRKSYRWGGDAILALVLFSFPLQAHTLSDTSQAAGKVIDGILIQNRGVFDPQIPQYARFPYPLLNRLHVKTRPRVIRREMLFGPGERFNEDLAEETARNLRKFPFLGHVSITPVSPRSDTVDVAVLTEDQWTTNPDVVIDRRGNLNRWGIGVEEENFLGLGKALRMRFLKSTDRTLWRIIYEDYRLFGSRWALKTVGLRADDGKMAEMKGTRPLYALQARWSFSIGYLYEDGYDRLYDAGRLAASVPSRRNSATLSLTRVLGDQSLPQKLALNFAGESRAYSPKVNILLPGVPPVQTLLATGPAGRRTLQAEIAWSLEQVRFVHKKYIDRAGLTEDIRVGRSATLALGRAQGPGRRNTYGTLSAAFEKSTLIGKSQIAIFSVEGNAQVETSHLDNGKLAVFYHHYYQGLPSQTVLFGAAYTQTWRMDQPFQLVLGEDVGLRGYSARQFTGNRLLLVNFEDRVFTPVTLATIRLGFAPFFDAGMAWLPGQPVAWGDLRTSAGISLRLAFIKFGEAPVFRFDLSFPLRRSPGGNRYTIGFSFSPIFRSFQGPEAVVNRF